MPETEIVELRDRKAADEIDVIAIKPEDIRAVRERANQGGMTKTDLLDVIEAKKHKREHRLLHPAGVVPQPTPTPSPVDLNDEVDIFVITRDKLIIGVYPDPCEVPVDVRRLPDIKPERPHIHRDDVICFRPGRNIEEALGEQQARKMSRELAERGIQGHRPSQPAQSTAWMFRGKWGER
jgi:hypothetical protein